MRKTERQALDLVQGEEKRLSRALLPVKQSEAKSEGEGSMFAVKCRGC